MLSLLTEDVVEERPGAGGTTHIPGDWRFVRGLLKVVLAFATCALVAILYPSVLDVPWPTRPPVWPFAVLVFGKPLAIFGAGVLVAIRRGWARPVGLGLMAAGLYEFGWVAGVAVLVLLHALSTS